MLVGGGPAGAGVHRTTSQRCHRVAGSAPGRRTPSANVVSVQGVSSGTVIPSRALGQPNTCCGVLTVQGSPAGQASTAICHRRSNDDAGRVRGDGSGSIRHRRRDIGKSPDARRGRPGRPEPCVLTVQGVASGKASTANLSSTLGTTMWSGPGDRFRVDPTTSPWTRQRGRMPPGTAGTPGACVLTVQRGRQWQSPQQAIYRRPSERRCWSERRGRRGIGSSPCSDAHVLRRSQSHVHWMVDTR